MTDDVSRAFRVLERAGWTGLSHEEVFAGARALLAQRARTFLKHAGSRVSFTFAFRSGSDGEPLIVDDSMLVEHDDSQVLHERNEHEPHVAHCPVTVGHGLERCACPGSAIDVRERAERARIEARAVVGSAIAARAMGPRCSFVGLDGLRCDLPTNHDGDCVLA